jgi:hypothetical protein
MIKNNLCVLAVLLICLIIIAPISLAAVDGNIGAGVITTNNPPVTHEIYDPYENVNLPKEVIDAIKKDAGQTARAHWNRGIEEAEDSTVLNTVGGVFLGSDVREFFDGSESAKVARPAILRAVRNAAEKRGYQLSPKEEQLFTDVAYENIQPANIETVFAHISGTLHAGAELAAIIGAPFVETVGTSSGTGGAVLKWFGPGGGKNLVYIANDLLNEDLKSAAASTVATLGMKVLPYGMGKLANTKISKASAKIVGEWVRSASSITGDVSIKIVKGGVKKTIKVSMKRAIMAAIVAGENFGLSDSEQERLGIKPDHEFYQMQQAPDDTWGGISNGDPDKTYRTAVDSDGVLRIFQKDQDGVILRKVDGNWKEIHPANPVNFGSNEDKFDQASWGDWLPIDAGCSGCTFRKFQDEDTGELVLYKRDPYGSVFKQNEDGDLVAITQQDRTRMANIMHVEAAARDGRRQELLGKFETLEEELPTPEEHYAYGSENWIEEAIREKELADELTKEDPSFMAAHLVYGDDGVSTEGIMVDGVLMPVSEYARRYELKRSYTELKGVLNRPSKELEFDWEWTLKGNDFWGQITITTIDGERKTVKFSSPGSFLEMVEDVGDLGIANTRGSTIQSTIPMLKHALAEGGWKKEGKEDKQLAFVDQAAPDRPVSICEK